MTAKHIKTYDSDRNRFDSLGFSGKNQQEKFQAMLTEFEELRAFKARIKDNPLYDFQTRKETTIQGFLGDIPNAILFQKEGNYKGKELRSYPGVLKKRLQRLVDTLQEINQWLEPGEQIKTTVSTCKTILNGNWTSIKKAWDELELEETDGKTYSNIELEALEIRYLPESDDPIFPSLNNQQSKN
jgi:hypothetical protein